MGCQQLSVLHTLSRLGWCSLGIWRRLLHPDVHVSHGWQHGWPPARASTQRIFPFQQPSAAALPPARTRLRAFEQHGANWVDTPPALPAQSISYTYCLPLQRPDQHSPL